MYIKKLKGFTATENRSHLTWNSACLAPPPQKPCSFQTHQSEPTNFLFPPSPPDGDRHATKSKFPTFNICKYSDKTCPHMISATPYLAQTCFREATCETYLRNSTIFEDFLSSFIPCLFLRVYELFPKVCRPQTSKR